MHTFICCGCKSEVGRQFRHIYESNSEKELIEIECDFVQE